MDIPHARFTKRLGQGATSVIYRLGKDYAIKILSQDYLEKYIRPVARSLEEASDMCRKQLTWEHTVATELRNAGIESVVKTYGVHEVPTRWFDTRLRAVKRLALVMEFVAGVPITRLDDLLEPVARSRLGSELAKARRAGYVPDERVEDPAHNALYDERTSDLKIIDFTFWDAKPYAPAYENPRAER